MKIIESGNQDVYNPTETVSDELNTPVLRPAESQAVISMPAETSGNEGEESAGHSNIYEETVDESIKSPGEPPEVSETSGPVPDLPPENSRGKQDVNQDASSAITRETSQGKAEQKSPGQNSVPESVKTAPPEFPKDSASIPSQASEERINIVNPYVRYTYEQMMDESLKLADSYPDIISLDSIGNSVEGRNLLLIKLGKGDKKIILCGSHHAREYISSSYLMKMVEEYARAYSSNSYFGKYNVREILDCICIYIVPMVNPDGVNLVNKGIDAVGNQEAVEAMVMLRPSYREWKANINGVDLNRQYPAQWEEKYDEVGKPASESFKGTAAATEPEIQAMMKLSNENDFILAASFHTKGNVIYWADRATVNLIPGVKDMAKRLVLLTRYQSMPVSEDPAIYGAGYENWFRLAFLRPAFCIELTPYNNTDVPHDDKKFDSLVWNNAKYIGLFLAEEALYR
ncbi:MAG: hypothetical protein GX022_07665 [Clostridiaceae bacterium]|nr:hypothetical protein [Clostridiaceae bacterium]